jgi:hypothetical protein
LDGRANLADGLRVCPAERDATPQFGRAKREAVRRLEGTPKRPKKTKLLFWLFMVVFGYF